MCAVAQTKSLIYTTCIAVSVFCVMLEQTDLTKVRQLIISWGRLAMFECTLCVKYSIFSAYYSIQNFLQNASIIPKDCPIILILFPSKIQKSDTAKKVAFSDISCYLNVMKFHVSCTIKYLVVV